MNTNVEISKNVELLKKLGIHSLPSRSAETIQAVFWMREVLQKHLSICYGVREKNGIEELKAIKIGGVEQWLHIRGRNKDNPILLYLHGGPGGSMIGWVDGSTRPWEDYFTVVHWDQRQTGKSYYKADDKNQPLTVDQFVRDAEEITQYLRDYFSQQKILVLGHSWGSVIGIKLIKNHPDWIHAYIGVGQVVNLIDNERMLFKRLLRHAKRQKEKKLIDKLNSISSYPCIGSPDKAFIKYAAYLRNELSRIARETNRHNMSMRDMEDCQNIERFISPHLTLSDLNNYVFSAEIALFRPPAAFQKEFMEIDLPNDVGSSFDVPIFFFTGSHDWHTPKILSDKWFKDIEAPYKELVDFQNSSHFVFNEEPGRMLLALVNKVLPCVNNVFREDIPYD